MRAYRGLLSPKMRLATELIRDTMVAALGTLHADDGIYSPIMLSGIRRTCPCRSMQAIVLVASASSESPAKTW